MFRLHRRYLFSLIIPQTYGAEYSFKVNTPAICCNPHPAPICCRLLRYRPRQYRVCNWLQILDRPLKMQYSQHNLIIACIPARLRPDFQSIMFSADRTLIYIKRWCSAGLRRANKVQITAERCLRQAELMLNNGSVVRVENLVCTYIVLGDIVLLCIVLWNTCLFCTFWTTQLHISCTFDITTCFSHYQVEYCQYSNLNTIASIPTWWSLK